MSLAAHEAYRWGLPKVEAVNEALLSKLIEELLPAQQISKVVLIFYHGPGVREAILKKICLRLDFFQTALTHITHITFFL